MPIFNFRNINTAEVIEKVMPYKEKVKFLEDNDDWVGIITSAPRMISGIRNSDPSANSDGAWTEVMSKVAEAHPNSSVGERYGKKSIKDVKTKAVIEKHRKSLKSRIE